MEIEFNLDQILKERGISIRGAAKLCGISYPTAQAMVHNTRTRVDLLTLSKLATGLGVNTASLLREKIEP